jgi:hypothetical protein
MIDMLLLPPKDMLTTSFMLVLPLLVLRESSSWMQSTMAVMESVRLKVSCGPKML